MSLGPALASYLVAGRLAAQPAPPTEPLDDAEIEVAPGQAAPNTSAAGGDTAAPPSNASAPSVREPPSAAPTPAPVTPSAPSTPSAPVGIATSPGAAPSGSIAQQPDSSETHTAAQKTYTATEKAAPAPAPLVDVLGYAQLEYQSHQDSEEQLRQGGALLNQDRFLVRRARLVFKRRWE
ncbi:MAG TPA: hypothetical protein VFQ61_04780, partial [Polyangiaceae bacterium]|nr:hypothetical protein [Polyangiaceae bacterium]